ncbi:MAG: hypothetical protein EPO06_09410 [Burkholderiaceae bacterium]|nr:MAG: hypothetical protein EPO06_09410 [Burkholderiaceae bacterium]
MKYHEIKEDGIRKARIGHIESRWDALYGVIVSSRTRILNLLFALNAGSLVGALTYIATKGNTREIHFSIWCFLFGIGFIVAHATIDYYGSETHFKKFRNNVTLFYKNELDWEVLLERDSQHTTIDRVLHFFGWLSGISLAIGLFVGICAIAPSA